MTNPITPDGKFDWKKWTDDAPKRNLTQLAEWVNKTFDYGIPPEPDNDSPIAIAWRLHTLKAKEGDLAKLIIWLQTNNQ